jgi:hypothetical protein
MPIIDSMISAKLMKTQPFTLFGYPINKVRLSLHKAKSRVMRWLILWLKTGWHLASGVEFMAKIALS